MLSIRAPDPPRGQQNTCYTNEAFFVIVSLNIVCYSEQGFPPGTVSSTLGRIQCPTLAFAPNLLVERIYISPVYHLPAAAQILTFVQA